MELYKFLNAISSGYLPPENEDEEEWRRFDHHSNQDLALFYASMMEVFSSGGLMRVLMAAHALLNPNNKLVDPTKDYLEFHPRIKQTEDELAKVKGILVGLVGNIEDLIGESRGVYGLHLNGDVAPWDELEPGGRFERLTHLKEARDIAAAVAEASAAEQAQESADHQRDVAEGR